MTEYDGSAKDRQVGMAMRALLCFLAGVGGMAAQLIAPANFSTSQAALQIVAPCVAGKPWTVAGEHGALLGRQNGRFEAWQWPVKILSDFRIRAELADYAVPIDVNALAAEIRVTPAETVITYSHAAFTVRQHMFAARGSADAMLGAAVFFEIDAARRLDLTFSFTPEMLRMWPAPNYGRPNGEWVAKGSGGVYVLHTDNPEVSAVVGMARTRPGILVPYQEHPQTYPLELKLTYDPQRDRGLVFPLIMALAKGGDAAAQASEANAAIATTYAQTQNYYKHFFDHRVIVETPDRRVNEGLQWAEIAVDQMQVSNRGETGLVAGYYESADSARPGYAWFFGRDTLWTTYAINSYGDFGLTRRGLDFLLRRQREDGKIMHEYSQAADSVDWSKTPYFYASADATPLLVMAMWDYVKASGDQAYLKANWPAVRKAYQFTRQHEGDDGIYSNAEGTGWVESWPPGMPHGEIYLAALDQQSSEAAAKLGRLAGDAALAGSAEQKAAAIAAKIETEYYEAGNHSYAFSRNKDGSLDHTASIYPAVAWWDGTFQLNRAGPMLSRWASDEFSTDWGTRDISERTPFYDPISYHQGSIWPLFTGWVSVAEYRTGRSLTGYAHLMQNLNLTWAQDLGSVTELLSGEFFQPLGRSSSHQMWSSAMVITPLLRGLFGLEADALKNTLTVAPKLPADWDRARLLHVPLGASEINLELERAGGKLLVRAKTEKAEVLCLKASAGNGEACRSAPARERTLEIALDAVELGITAALPGEGARTSQLKVLEQHFENRQATFRLAAQGGTAMDLALRMNEPHVTVDGAQMNGNKLHVKFPDGAGYQERLIRFTW